MLFRPSGSGGKEGNDTSSHDGNQGREEEHGCKQDMFHQWPFGMPPPASGIEQVNTRSRGTKEIAPLARHYDGSGEEPRTEGNQARSMTIR